MSHGSKAVVQHQVGRPSYTRRGEQGAQRAALVGQPPMEIRGVEEPNSHLIRSSLYPCQGLGGFVKNRFSQDSIKLNMIILEKKKNQRKNFLLFQR